jgi:predicted RNase H-like HicB family nuclease
MERIEMKRQETERPMRNEFTAIFERDGEWHIAYCPEIPGANGQGHTKVETRRSLADAIALILEDRRRDGLRGLPRGAVRERVVVG